MYVVYYVMEVWMYYVYIYVYSKMIYRHDYGIASAYANLFVSLYLWLVTLQIQKHPCRFNALQYTATSPSKLAQTLLSNVVSHWLSPYTEWSMQSHEPEQNIGNFASDIIKNIYWKNVCILIDISEKCVLWRVQLTINTGLILVLRSANERQVYFVTTSLNGWVQA